MTVKEVMEEINLLKNGYKSYLEAAKECIESDRYNEASNLTMEADLLLFRIKKLENRKTINL